MTRTRPLISLSLLTLVLLAACGGASTATKDCDRDFIKEGFTLQIQRGSCFGKCPTYLATIKPDGTVEYEGRQFVTFIGDFTATLTRQQMCRLAELVDNADYFKLDSNMRDMRVADAPVTNTRVSRNGYTHSVTRDIKAPEALRELENYLDTVTYLNPALLPR